MLPQLCDGCNKPILTDHPFSLCADCDLRKATELAKERAWRQAPLSKRALVRSLDVSTFAFGFACGSVALWVMEPAFYRLLNHLWPVLVIVATFAGCYTSYQNASRLRRQITDAEPIKTWYPRRS
jgi:hypothetical protein